LEIIKICGITRVEDALMAIRAGATAIGLNFYPGSPRYLDVGRAAMIAAVAPPSVLKVGVFVDEEIDRIRAVAGAARLDVAQLHGAEPPIDCELLEPCRVWKALQVDEDFNPRLLADYKCEAFLLDTGGGAGQPFPWALAREAARYGRIIVAGGLDQDNVGEAIRQLAPWGVDASSRLERSPGVKDPERVAAFIQAARQAAALAAGEP